MHHSHYFQYHSLSRVLQYIQVYNYGSANPTDPVGANYHPHTVDITGYDFTQWYINENHTDGYKMVVTITGSAKNFFLSSAAL